MRGPLSLLFCTVLLVGCGPSTEVLMLGGDAPARSPVSAESVAIYRDTAEIACPYERVALVEAQDAEDAPFDAGVSQLKLIRAARGRAGEVGANGLLVERVDAESALKREVTADSTGYEERETRQSWGRGLFLAIYEERPCS